jgi:uncharacterized phiE125 gp8 family phage protein
LNITVVQAPAFYPVTLSEVYDHLRLTPEGSPEAHEDDAMLERHIRTATSHAEQITRRSFIQQTLRITAPSFRATELLRPPLMEVLSVRYYDSTNTLATLSASDYYVTDDMVPELRYVTSFAAPSVYSRPDAVRIDYVTGYEPDGSPVTTQEEYAANVPDAIKDAILIGVQLLYDAFTPEQRKAAEDARDALLSPYRVFTV